MRSDTRPHASGRGAAYSAFGLSEEAGSDSSCRSLCGQGPAVTQKEAEGPSSNQSPHRCPGITDNRAASWAKVVQPREMGSECSVS